MTIFISRKMSSTRSKIWEHFKKSDDKQTATCLYCLHTFQNKGTTTSLWNHYKFFHNFSNNDDAVSESQHDSQSSVHSDEPSSNKRPLESTSTESLPKRTRLSRVSATVQRGTCISKERQELITQTIVNMIRSDLLPLSIVEYDGFKNLLAILEPGYKMPCRKTISNRLLAMYNEEADKVKTILTPISDLAVTTDCWTSRATQSYMTLTAHFLDSDWTSQSYNLLTEEMTESHTADHLEDSLHAGMMEWEISDKVANIVHDNAVNISNAVENLSYDGIESHRCSAHTIQLSVKAGLKLGECDTIIKKVSKLVSSFNHSTKRTYALEKHLQQTEKPVKKLIQSCATRWNSELFMLERAVDLRPSLVAVIADRSIFNKKAAQKIEISESEWNLMDSLVKVLKPFELATVVLSSDSEITISKVRPIIHKIITKHMKFNDDDSKLIKRFKSTVSDDLKKRFNFDEIEESEQKDITVSHIASFLDPRFKSMKFEESHSVRQAVKDKVEHLYQRARQDSTLSNSESCGNQSSRDELKKKIGFTAMDLLLEDDDDSDGNLSPNDEFQRYVAEKEVNHNLSANTWWREHEKIYPILAKLAKKYLAVPATSTSSERVFSSAGNIVRPSRSCLSSEMVSALVFLHQNRIKKVKSD